MSSASAPAPPEEERVHVLLLGGRSGVGKSTVGWEVSARLQELAVAHCLIEGDNLDQAFPAPPDDPHRSRMTEANLAALWRNYAALGYRRLVYTNTVSILEPDLIRRAVGGLPRITAVLLTSTDATAAHRLRGREVGSQLEPHLRRSVTMARHLERAAPSWVVRVPTDDRPVTEVADEVVKVTGWAP